MGRIRAPHYVHILIFQIYEYVMLHSKGKDDQRLHDPHQRGGGRVSGRTGAGVGGGGGVGVMGKERDEG